MYDKLLPCPFCGAEPEILGFYIIRCPSCRIQTIPRLKLDEVVDAWNRRIPNPFHPSWQELLGWGKRVVEDAETAPQPIIQTWEYFETVLPTGRSRETSLNALGRGGWELIAIDANDISYFKRLITTKGDNP